MLRLYNVCLLLLFTSFVLFQRASGSRHPPQTEGAKRRAAKAERLKAAERAAKLAPQDVAPESLASRNKQLPYIIGVPNMTSAYLKNSELPVEDNVLKRMRLQLPDGCRQQETFCKNKVCVCLTPGTLVGSNSPGVSKTVGQRMPRGFIHLAMPTLPGIDSVQIRSLWEALTGLVSETLTPEQGAEFNQRTMAYSRRCGGIKKSSSMESEDQTLSADAEPKQCKEIHQSAYKEPVLVHTTVDMAANMSNLQLYLQTCSVEVKVVRNPLDQFAAYLQSAANMRYPGTSAAEYLQNPSLSDLPALEATLARSSALGSRIAAQMSDNYTVFNFEHWFRHQWLGYNGNGSTINAPDSQIYVLRYEDLKLDPVGTLVDFLATTGVGRELGIGEKAVKDLLAQTNSVVILGDKFKRDFFRFEIEPLGRRFGQVENELDVYNVLRQYRGILEQYGYLYYTPDVAKHITDVRRLRMEQLRGRETRTVVSIQEVGGRAEEEERKKGKWSLTVSKELFEGNYKDARETQVVIKSITNDWASRFFAASVGFAIIGATLGCLCFFGFKIHLIRKELAKRRMVERIHWLDLANDNCASESTRNSNAGIREYKSVRQVTSDRTPPVPADVQDSSTEFYRLLAISRNKAV